MSSPDAAAVDAVAARLEFAAGKAVVAVAVISVVAAGKTTRRSTAVGCWLVVGCCRCWLTPFHYSSIINTQPQSRGSDVYSRNGERMRCQNKTKSNTSKIEHVGSLTMQRLRVHIAHIVKAETIFTIYCLQYLQYIVNTMFASKLAWFDF